MTELGTFIRQLRREAQLTQEQLAEASTVSVRTIRRLEGAGSPDPRLSTLMLLADALNATEEERSRLAELATGMPGATAPQPTEMAEPTEVAEPTEPTEVADVAEVAEPPGDPQPLPSPPPARRRPFPLRGSLTDAADRLARELRHRWQSEEDHRRIHDPFPLPVRWHEAAADLRDRPENVQRLGPGVPPVELDLSGDITRIAEVHRRIPSRRLAIIGRAGSGKSILAIRLVLDLLAEDRPDRIPVVFGLSSWDPGAVTLSDWMESQLLRDHPDLAGRAPGEPFTLAAALIRSDALLPVLDGFDEIGEGLRAQALRELNRTLSPLVLTSRQAELAEAIDAVHAPLLSAAVIELEDLAPADLLHYLPRTGRPHLPAPSAEPDGWDQVLPALHHPDTEAARGLAQVLSTPLMITLARTLYSDVPDHSPAELLDESRFPSTHAVEEHLLAGFVPALYRHRPGAPADWDAARAHRWLALLADHLGRSDRERSELAWWRLGELLPRSTRILAVGLAAVLLVTVPACTLGLLFDLSVSEVLLQGVLVGLAAGFAFGSAYAVTLTVNHGESWKPTFARLRWPRGGEAKRVRSVRALTAHLGAFALASFVLGAGCATASSAQWYLFQNLSITDPHIRDTAIANMTLFGLTFSTATTALWGLLAALEAPMDTASAATPLRLLAANRSTISRQALLLFPLFGTTISVGGHFWAELLQGTFGPYDWGLQRAITIGAIGSISAIPAYVLAFTAWGQWLLLVRIWLPLTGRLPWNTIAFLDDAYRRGALRQAGAVYQFRHIRLQHHLGNEHRRRSPHHGPARLTD